MVVVAALWWLRLWTLKRGRVLVPAAFLFPGWLGADGPFVELSAARCLSAAAAVVLVVLVATDGGTEPAHAATTMGAGGGLARWWSRRRRLLLPSSQCSEAAAAARGRSCTGQASLLKQRQEVLIACSFSH